MTVCVCMCVGKLASLRRRVCGMIVCSYGCFYAGRLCGQCSEGESFKTL